VNFRPFLFIPALSIFLPQFANAQSAPVSTNAPTHLPNSAQEQIEAILNDENLRDAHVGVAIVALGRSQSPATSQVQPFIGGAQPLLFGRDAEKRFLPASNFKLFTAAWTLESLGAAHTFATRVSLAPLRFLREGAWPVGEPLPVVVRLEGEGDPSLKGEDLRQLAQYVSASPSVKGKSVVVNLEPSPLHAEESGGRYPDGWTLDDATWDYGAPITGWALDRNEIDVTLTGTKAGELADMKVEGEMPMSIFNGVVTAPDAASATGAHFDRGDARSALGASVSISGTVAAGSRDHESLAVPDPNAWIRARFAALLRARGVRVVDPNVGYAVGQEQEIARHTSAPIGAILRDFLKPSDNLYGEMLLRASATRTPKKKWPQIASTGLAAQSHGALLDWLDGNGVPVASLRMSDGSGLSRYNLVTPLTLARLLALESKQKDAAFFYDALPLAGVDGTLAKRMKGTRAQNNARAKTGTFSIVNCLSGYVTTRDGVRLAVSVLTNFAPDGDRARESESRVFEALADTSFSP